MFKRAILSLTALASLTMANTSAHADTPWGDWSPVYDNDDPSQVVGEVRTRAIPDGAMVDYRVQFRNDTDKVLAVDFIFTTEAGFRRDVGVYYIKPGKTEWTYFYGHPPGDNYQWFTRITNAK